MGVALVASAARQLTLSMCMLHMTMGNRHTPKYQP